MHLNRRSTDNNEECSTLCMLLGNFSSFFCCLVILFWKSFFSYKVYFNISIVSIRLDPDQVRQYVRPHPAPNCLQRSWEDNSSRQRVKRVEIFLHIDPDKQDFMCKNVIIARKLKKLRTSKGDYLVKQWFSSIAPLFKSGTSLKGKNLLPEGANSFL